VLVAGEGKTKTWREGTDQGTWRRVGARAAAAAAIAQLSPRERGRQRARFGVNGKCFFK
jgi:hypothetical protein